MKDRKGEFLPLIIFGILGIVIFTVIFKLIDNIPEEEEPELEATPIVFEAEDPAELLIEETVVIEEAAEPKVSDRDIIAMVVMSEAGTEKFIGKVAVAAVVLNRASADDMTIEEVVTSPHQFSYPYYGTVSTACYEAADFAMEHRDLFPKNMLYFRNTKYHRFGEPYEQIGNHYFSTNGEPEWDLETLGDKD